MDSESRDAAGRRAIRPSLPWCFSVAKGSVLGACVSSLELISCDLESDVEHGPLQAAGAVHPSLPLCFSAAMH